MAEFDVVARIQGLCAFRSWTYYRLAKTSGIPYSTLSTMLHKTNVPSVPSLTKICLIIVYCAGRTGKLTGIRCIPGLFVMVPYNGAGRPTATLLRYNSAHFQL